MKINENILNTDLEYCINEYVRLVEHRDILREKWFMGYTLDELAEKYHKSTTSIKKIIYGTGDKILIKASEMSRKTD
jgi:hypothetical protein